MDELAFLEATGIFSGYGETEILHGVSIALEAGEFVTIIGPNGAGKSTLIKTIIGLIRPSRGRVTFAGRDITGARPEDLVLHGLAYVPQSSNTFPTLTVRENLEMGAITRRPGLWPRLGAELLRVLRREPNGEAGALPDATIAPPYTADQFEERVERVCTIFPNLRPKLGDKVLTLSGGEQQMVALARTLVLEPKTLLVDEPSAGLAPKLVISIFDKIQEINGHGVGIVLVEQNARKALGMADRGYVLEAGKNRFEGPGRALLANPEVGRLYLGG